MARWRPYGRASFHYPVLSGFVIRSHRLAGSCLTPAPAIGLQFNGGPLSPD